MAKMKLDGLLKRHRFSQKDLADYTGINKNTISRYCNNTFEKIDKGHLDLLCDFFKCSPNDLFELEPVQQKMFRPSDISNWLDISKSNVVGHEYNKKENTLLNLKEEHKSGFVSSRKIIKENVEFQNKHGYDRMSTDDEIIKLEDEQEQDFKSVSKRIYLEYSVDKLVFNFINKIMELFLVFPSTDEYIKEITQDYNQYDYSKTGLKIRKFYRIFYSFLSEYNDDKSLLGLLMEINNIYKNDGFDSLTDEELNNLEKVLKYYLSNTWNIKQINNNTNQKD